MSLMMHFMFYVAVSVILGLVQGRHAHGVTLAHKSGGVGLDGLTTASTARLLELRGGGKQSGEEEGRDGGDDEDDDDFDEMDFSDGSASGKNLLSGVGEMWAKTPPMTQAYCGASVAITVACWALNKNQWPEALNLKWSAVLGGQIWRPFTAFLFFGPFGLNYILTMQVCTTTYTRTLMHMRTHSITLPSIT